MIIVAALAIAATVVGVALPAAATSATYFNPQPCSASINGGYCISEVGATYENGSVTLTMTVGRATDPTTDPSWFPGAVPNSALVNWNVSPSDATTPEFSVVVFDPGGNQFGGGVTEYGTGATTCDSFLTPGVEEASFNLAQNSYSFTFPASCLGVASASFSVIGASYRSDSSALVGTIAEPGSGPAFCCSVTDSTIPPPSPPLPPVTSPSSTSGYDLVAADGGIFTFGTAPFHGSANLSKVVGMAVDSQTGGYRIATADGGLWWFDSSSYGWISGALNAPVVGIATDNSTDGYWMVASDGGVFAFNAPFFGSMGGTRLNRPIVGMASTPDGGGYWLVASDGGVFAFGDAGYCGSMGGTSLSQPVVGMTGDAATGGYWLIAKDGGVFAFNAPFFGSMGGRRLNAPVVGVASTRGSGGYWFVASDGGVFTFGDAQFRGSEGGSRLDAPIVGMVATG
jgi:hypothetical protein